MGEAEMMMGFVAGIVIGVLALVAGRVLLLGAMRRTLGRLLAVAALGLASLAERLLDDGRPAATLDLAQGPGPATQQAAVWVGEQLMGITLSLN